MHSWQGARNGIAPDGTLAWPAAAAYTYASKGTALMPLFTALPLEQLQTLRRGRAVADCQDSWSPACRMVCLPRQEAVRTL